MGDAFKLLGTNNGDKAGYAVWGTGDFNGDGYSDILVGADNYGGAGAAYVIFGKAAAFAATINLNALTGADGFRMDGLGAGYYTGTSVHSAFDVNGDGFDDLIIGADYADPLGRTDAGSVYVVFGTDAAMTATGSEAKPLPRGGGRRPSSRRKPAGDRPGRKRSGTIHSSRKAASSGRWKANRLR